jgi:hypothetical protein
MATPAADAFIYGLPRRNIYMQDKHVRFGPEVVYKFFFFSHTHTSALQSFSSNSTLPIPQALILHYLFRTLSHKCTFNSIYQPWGFGNARMAMKYAMHISLPKKLFYWLGGRWLPSVICKFLRREFSKNTRSTRARAIPNDLHLLLFVRELDIVRPQSREPREKYPTHIQTST